MAGKIILSTDSSSDVLKGLLDAHDVRCIPLTYTIDGETRDGLFSDESEYVAFYEALRAKKMPTTSLINEYLYQEYFRTLAAEGPAEIVHLSLSSGLSSSCANAIAAAETVMQECPTVKIHIVDSLGATQAQRIILDEGIRLRDQGLSAQEIADGMRKCVSETQVYIVVDDLFHLKRGGRVSGAAAVIGTALKLKPIIILDDKGRLEVVAKVPGRKKAFKYVLDHMREQGVNLAEQTVYIASADSAEYAAEMRAMIEEAFGCKVLVDWVGPVIGAHTGADMIGIVYRGEKRLTK